MPTCAANQPRIFQRSRTIRTAAATLLALVAGATSARADVYKDRINADFKGVAEDKRTDKVILPLLIALEPAPAVARSQQQAALFSSFGPGWDELKAWSQKPTQTAVLDALAKVTKEEDRPKAYAFAQAYGADISDLDMVVKRMYTELGEPELLSAARHLYMPAIENAGILVHVEASRLAESGKVYESLKLLNDWLFFCRQMADRKFLREKRWAMDSMKLAFERMRDVVYVDMSAGKKSMDSAKVLEINKRLKDRRGFLAIERIRLPEGDFTGREQLVAAIMGSDGTPSPETFGPTLARAASRDRPLRLFSAAAFWDGVRPGHANAKQTKDMLATIVGDWTKRWDLNYFDRLLTIATDYRRQVATTPKFASLQLGLGEVEDLFQLRHLLNVELAGTRMSLGAYGFYLRHTTLPTGLSQTRPDYIEGVDKDPYSRRDGDLQYFVPQRDTPRDADGNPKPHTVEIFAPDPLPKFSVPLGDKTFALYSIGPDEDRGNLLYATQTRPGVPGDYLLFPPLLSLERQRLIDTGQLK